MAAATLGAGVAALETGSSAPQPPVTQPPAAIVVHPAAVCEVSVPAHIAVPDGSTWRLVLDHAAGEQRLSSATEAQLCGIEKAAAAEGKRR